MPFNWASSCSTADMSPPDAEPCAEGGRSIIGRVEEGGRGSVDQGYIPYLILASLYPPRSCSFPS